MAKNDPDIIDQMDDALSDAATRALGDAGEQDSLDGLNLPLVKFVGMSYESTEVPDLKAEVEFLVRGTVVGEGREVMADGHIREFRKVKVRDVIASPAKK